MTRPSIVRADTIDLQDHDSPSAQDHHRQNHSTAGAHQAETLREVAHESAEEQLRSPRLSWTSGVSENSNVGDDLAASVAIRMQQQQEGGFHRDAGEDPLAVAQNGGVSSSDEGDLDGDDLDDDMMDRISSSPSIEDEDIDFEFVYALHTFVATVEGQANATKGDTMVLLDDSNSYWWLVRVVKDSSIGYLPAEHIETPTERLARLNKHRNVDLSATMLGDQPGKQKNSFKAIRKRWKSVTFSEPTYVDYAGVDYSSDEEDIEELFGNNVLLQRDDEDQQQKQQQQQPQETASSQQVEEQAASDGAGVEPLRTRSKDATGDDEAENGADDASETRDSEDILDAREEGPSRSRNGTVRNTDSFFKDDSVETKKITLTPNLLRDDTASRPSTDSAGSRDTKSRPSLDSKMDKELVSDKDKRGRESKDKRDKDKKPSAIRNFFSRKDKKRMSEDDDAESFGKRSMDVVSEPRDSEEPAADTPQSPDKNAMRSPTKLQKQQPRTEPSPAQKGQAPKKPPQPDIAAHYTESRTNDVSYVPPASMRIVDPDTQETKEVPSNQQQQWPQPREDKGGLAQSLMPRSGSETLVKPQKTTKAAARMELDESDSSEAEAILDTVASPVEEQKKAHQPPPVEEEQRMKPLRPQLPGAFPESYVMDADTGEQPERENQPERDQADRGQPPESPGNVSPASANPPGLTGDYSPSPVGSPMPDPGQADDTAQEGKEPQQTWDDTKLRAFFDEGEHVRDLLAVVYDTTDVEPAGHDHPVVGGLFREQNAKLAEITTQLDNMLGDWLARKQRSRGTL